MSLCQLQIGGPAGGPAGGGPAGVGATGAAGWLGRLSGASASLLPRKSGAGEDEERFGGVGDGCSDAWRESGGKAVASTRYTNLSYLSACRFRVRVRFGFGLGLGFGFGFGFGLGLGLGLGFGGLG